MASLSIPELIVKKRDGERLSEQEIQHFVQAVVQKTIQDSQLGKCKLFTLTLTVVSVGFASSFF